MTTVEKSQPKPTQGLRAANGDAASTCKSGRRGSHALRCKNPLVSGGFWGFLAWQDASAPQVVFASTAGQHQGAGNLGVRCATPMGIKLGVGVDAGIVWAVAGRQRGRQRVTAESTEEHRGQNCIRLCGSPCPPRSIPSGLFLT